MSGLVARLTTLTLPSGQTVVVRRPGMRTHKYVVEPLPRNGSDATPDQHYEFGIRLAISCAVDPPLTNDPEQVGKDAGDGKVYSDLEDLDLNDCQSLIKQCLKLMELSSQGAKEEVAPLSQTSESSSE